MRHFRKRIIAGTVALMMPMAVFAQNTAQEVNEIIRGLDPAQVINNTTQVDGKQRLKIIIRHQQEQLLIDYGSSIDLSVLFRLNNASLTLEGRQVLDNLSAALLSAPIQKFRYLIAGHTDASGPASYNYQLSLKRAEAVKLYLVNMHGIDPSRFVTFGWGENRLKNKTRPFSGENRRVEISLITQRVTTVPEGVNVVVQTANTGPQIIVAPASANGVELSVESAVKSPTTTTLAVPPIEPPATIQKKTTYTAEECVAILAKDPRPQDHKLDDFNTGRTPLPCEERAKNQPVSSNNLKINF